MVNNFRSVLTFLVLVSVQGEQREKVNLFKSSAETSTSSVSPPSPIPVSNMISEEYRVVNPDGGIQMVQFLSNSVEMQNENQTPRDANEDEEYDTPLEDINGKVNRDLYIPEQMFEFPVNQPDRVAILIPQDKSEYNKEDLEKNYMLDRQAQYFPSNQINALDERGLSNEKNSFYDKYNIKTEPRIEENANYKYPDVFWKHASEDSDDFGRRPIKSKENLMQYFKIPHVSDYKMHEAENYDRVEKFNNANKKFISGYGAKKYNSESNRFNIPFNSYKEQFLQSTEVPHYHMPPTQYMPGEFNNINLKKTNDIQLKTNSKYKLLPHQTVAEFTKTPLSSRYFGNYGNSRQQNNDEMSFLENKRQDQRLKLPTHSGLLYQNNYGNVRNNLAGYQAIPVTYRDKIATNYKIAQHS